MDKIRTRNKRLLFILSPLLLMGIITISLIFSIVFNFKTIHDIRSMPFERLLFGIIESFVAVFTYNFVIQKLNIYYPWNRNWLIRAIIDFGVAMVLPTIVITSIQLGFSNGWLPNDDHLQKYRMITFIMPIMVSALMIVIVEMILATEERNKLELQLSTLEKEQINTKYNALKEQLDHHFLFNNLSVLSSIVYESAEKADLFIQDFAAIYRYVLSINRQDLVALKDELDFIEKYLNLYKYRFEEGFEYQININSNKLDCLIPPLTLQVVVENALKHNIISSTQPLVIKLEIIDNNLIVKNNIQLKPVTIPSTQTGQRNLIEKFKLLNHHLPEFKTDDQSYIANIPLILPTND